MAEARQSAGLATAARPRRRRLAPSGRTEGLHRHALWSYRYCEVGSALTWHGCLGRLVQAKGGKSK